MQYKVTKLYLVDAADRGEARRRVATEGAAHLKIISIQELKSTGARDANTARWTCPSPVPSRKADSRG